MAIKIPGMKFLAGADAKSRVFLLFAGVAAISLVIFFIIRFISGGPTPTAGSKVATAPSSMQTVPGGQMSPEFYRAVVQANAQAAKQAQISGGSAVPTLINVPGQQSSFSTDQCTIVCPSEENANVADDINALVKAGKLSQDDANRLLDLAKKNVSVDEYAAALNDLVRQGKLTPEEARALLDKYKKQHANKLLAETGAAMDPLIKSGQLPLEVANELAALQRSGISPSDYAAELNRLVREGKISPETAARLLAQYTQQQMREQAKKGAFNLQQMAKQGEITADVAKDLQALQDKNVPVDQYAAELNRLVAAGKLTPAAAAKLLAEYKKQREGIGIPSTLNTLLNSSDPKVRDEAKKLADMIGNNASLADFTDELKRAVAAGLITPEEATRLLEEYRARLTPFAPPGETVTPGVQTNIPGAEDFAKLQQNLASATPPPAPAEQAAQFVAPPPPSMTPQEIQAMSQERQQRIAAIQSAMSGQAQSLLAAWQPPAMAHIGNSSPTESETGGAGGAGGKGGGGAVIKPPSAPIIKAGTILFAVLDTAVNSDYPDTPVMATIVQGQYKGAKLLGKLSLAKSVAGMSQDRVSLSFNQMDMESWPHTITINAFAIDPDTARTVMASNVDYHYLKRYGAMMGAAFVSGYANAIMTEGSTTTTGIFGTSTTHPQLSPTQKIAAGLGQIGTTIGSQIQNYINIPPTVVVNSGVGLGILFMSEVTLSEEKQSEIPSPKPAPTPAPAPAPSPAPKPQPTPAPLLK